MINKKLGYYSCNGQEFTSKIQCLLYASKLNKTASWHFNDDVFKEYNWHIEPEANVDELYDLRAREIREKYDYVVLNYSGGSDCHNILKSFHRQGLLLDEVVSNWIFDGSKNVTINDSRITDAWNQNAEFELNAKAKLQWITDNMPKTKISVYDCSTEVYKYFSMVSDDWVQNATGPVNPAAVQRYNILSIKDIRERIDRHKSVVTIIGIDKPRCRIYDDRLYLAFFDTIANIVPANVHFKDYDNTTIENFYWSPESCDMIAKQCHMVLKFLNTNKPMQKLWAKNNIMLHGNQAREDLLKNIIYTTWDQSFQVIKPTYDWYSQYDYWFTTQLMETKAGKNWRAGIDYLKGHINPSMLNDAGAKTLYSPEYYIGDIIP